MTGVSPQSLRLHLLNAAPDESIVVGIFNKMAYRLDVHVNGDYVMPNNGYMQNEKVLLRSFTAREYVPDRLTDANGANFFDNKDKLLWILVKGSDAVDITTSSAITLSFDLPGVTADEFFDTDNIRRNLALFLGIPADKIVVAKAVSENVRRRRREENVMSLIVTIIDQPSNYTNVNLTAESNDEANIAFERIVTGFQLGNLSEALNITIGNLAVTAPAPPPGSDAWTLLVEEGGETSSIVIRIPDSLVITEQPTNEVEQQDFGVLPMLQVTDSGVSVRSSVNH